MVTSQHTDVAAYSFGLLEEPDRLEFEAHLAGCEACAAELAELSQMAGLFEGVGPVDPGPDEPDDEGVVSLLRRRAGDRRRQALRRSWLAAAAAVVLLAGGAATGVAVTQGKVRQVTVVALAGQRHTATSASTGVKGTVGLEAKAWGTQVTLDLAGVRGPLDCELVAVSRTGERRVVTGWFVPASGYGVPGHPAHLLLMGGTSIPLTSMARVEVDVVGGAPLVKIAV